MAPFLQAAATQKRVLGALIMRELHTRYGKQGLGFLWLILEPILFVAAVIAIWSLFWRSSHGVPLIPFLVTGYLPLMLWRHMSSRSLSCIQANASLLYHRTIGIQDLFFSRFLIEIAGTLLAFATAYLLFYLAGQMHAPKNMAAMAGGWLLLFWFVVATGLIVGALAYMWEPFERIYRPFSYSMIILSGAFYMVQWIPAEYRDVVLYMPMVNCVELIRQGYFGDAVRTYSYPAYTAEVCAVMTLVGLLLVGVARQRIEFA